MYRHNQPHRKAPRQASAKERNERYAKMTTQQKLDLQLKGGHFGKQYNRLLAQATKEIKGA